MFLKVSVLMGQAAVLLLATTLTFDVMHYLLHRSFGSRFKWLRSIGALHEVHHRFFDKDLRFVGEFSRRNMVDHVIPEYLTKLFVALAAFYVFHPMAVGLVLSGQLIQLVLVIVRNGRDSNHVAVDTLLAPASGVFVGSRYHSLHHVYPDSHYSSLVTLFDRVFGTALSLKGRRVALTGASGAFGSSLKLALEKSGAMVRALKFGVDYSYGDYERLGEALSEADILVLAHGSKKDFALQANCDSFVAIIERFLALTGSRRFPVEIWAVGSEIEFHPAWGNADLQIYLQSKRAFARHAYSYYRNDRFVYRHICPAGFNSPMGWAPMPARMAVAIAMFLIRRGFRYVPVTYTGFAFLNYFKFLFSRGQISP